MNIKQKIEELFEKYEDEIYTLPRGLSKKVVEANLKMENLKLNLDVEENQMLYDFLDLQNEVLYEEIKNGFSYGFTLTTQLLINNKNIN